MSRVVENWKFRPHPLLANAHMQTVFGLRWPQRAAPYTACVHHVPLEDGDRLALHEDAPVGNAEDAPSILLLHGLSGGYDSSYMCRLVERLTPRGYRVFRLDMRGCGAGEGIARKPNHCGRSEDVASVLNFIAELYHDSPTALIAFSMGGTLALNMLAEAGEMRVGNFQRALMICPPIDLFSVERHFRTILGRPYDKFFVKNIWAQVLRRWQEFPETAPNVIPQRPKRLRDIDHLVVAPSGGFASAEDYYTKTQPGPKLEAIRQPVTILFSKDDPVVPFAPLFDYPHSSSVETIVTSHGGHLGFLGQPGLDADIRWIDWRILEWLEHAPCSVSPKKQRQRAFSQ